MPRCILIATFLTPCLCLLANAACSKTKRNEYRNSETNRSCKSISSLRLFCFTFMQSNQDVIKQAKWISKTKISFSLGAAEHITKYSIQIFDPVDISVSQWQRCGHHGNSILETRHIDYILRLRAKDLDRSEFEHRFEARDRPLIITSALKNWPASSEWSIEKLLKRFGDTKFKVGEVCAAHLIQDSTSRVLVVHFCVMTNNLSTFCFKLWLLDLSQDDNDNTVRLPFKVFVNYMRHQKDDSPLYLFESSFDEKRSTKSLLRDYEKPYFAPRNLFSIVRL